jgi:hypothetical protein
MQIRITLYGEGQANPVCRSTDQTIAIGPSEKKLLRCANVRRFAVGVAASRPLMQEHARRNQRAFAHGPEIAKEVEVES